MPGYESTIWLGFMAPAGTPKAIVDKLNAEIRKVMARPDVKEAWAKQGAVPMTMTPAEFDKYLRADIEKWAKVVKVSGAKVNWAFGRLRSLADSLRRNMPLVVRDFS